MRSPVSEPEVATLTSRLNLSVAQQRNIVIAALVIFAALFAYWIHQRATHVYSDDARIAGGMIAVSSEVAGRIVEFPVSSGDYLQPGDTIALIDARSARLSRDELVTQLDATEADYQRARAEINMVEQQTGGQLQAAQAKLNQALAGVASARADFEFRQNEWERSQSLKKRQIISLQDWEASRNAFERARQQLQSSQAQVATARAELVEAQASRSQLLVLESELKRLEHEKQRVAIQLERQEIDLANRTILAQHAGMVDKTFVDPGEYVTPGQRLLLMHDPNDIWIDANIKETEVRHLRVGEPVEIDVDAYPDRKFTGTVERIGDAATSQFALLPSANPSGNFTKVTQRLPIRIAIKQEDNLLKPGMMVEIAIDISER